MTFRDIAADMLRRWYVTVALLAAVGCLTYLCNENSGCYTTDTVVTFLLPDKSSMQKYNGVTDPSVISFAGAIATEVNRGPYTQPYAAADAPFYGAGLREAVFVGVPSTGGQWMAAFSTATIDIKIVGSSAEWVNKQQKVALAKIDAAARGRQARIPDAERISSTVEPLSTEIYHVMPSRSTRLMANGAMGVAGVTASAVASVLLDGLVGHVRKSQRRCPSQASLNVGALS